MTDGQRAYEARRAAKAGLSLEKWLELKRKEREAEARTARVPRHRRSRRRSPA